MSTYREWIANGPDDDMSEALTEYDIKSLTRRYIVETGVSREDVSGMAGSVNGEMKSFTDGELCDAETATHVLIPGTGWGNYSGSVLSRAMWTYLDVFESDHGIASYDGWYDAHEAVLVLDHEADAQMWECFVDMVRYGYMEGVDTFDMEQTIITEAWEGYLCSDVRDDIAQAIVGQFGDTLDVLDLIPDGDALLDMLYESPSAKTYGLFECGTATSAYMVEPADVVEWAADHIMADYMRPVVCEGQKALLP